MKKRHSLNHPDFKYDSANLTQSFTRRDSTTNNVSINYDTEDHMQVLFQMHGSVWKSVLPWCLMNTLSAYFIFHLDYFYGFNFSSSDKGHVFMSLMVSYLLLDRVHTSLKRYMEARQYLKDTMKSCRELVQHAVAFTRFGNNDEKGMKWRVDISKRTISVLRTIVSYLQYPSRKTAVWNTEGLSRLEVQAVLLAVGRSNKRAPLLLIVFLRSVIRSHIHVLENELDVNQELRLLDYTHNLVSAYHDIMTNVETPYPFPLVQMTRTFVIVYVFTLPFSLLNDFDTLWPLLFVVFFCTYGFIGLELISIEFDDPFGNDPNDFNVTALADEVYKDIIVLIRDIDGGQAAAKVMKILKVAEKDKMTSVRKTAPGEPEYISIPNKQDAPPINPNAHFGSLASNTSLPIDDVFDSHANGKRTISTSSDIDMQNHGLINTLDHRDNSGTLQQEPVEIQFDGAMRTGRGNYVRNNRSEMDRLRDSSMPTNSAICWSLADDNNDDTINFPRTSLDTISQQLPTIDSKDYHDSFSGTALPFPDAGVLPPSSSIAGIPKSPPQSQFQNKPKPQHRRRHTRNDSDIPNGGIIGKLRERKDSDASFEVLANEGIRLKYDGMNLGSSSSDLKYASAQEDEDDLSYASRSYSDDEESIAGESFHY